MKPDGFHGLQSFGGRLEVAADGTVVSYDDHGRPVRYVVSYDDHGRPVHYGDDRSRTLGTIVYKADGSIAGYEGRPGEMRAPPHVIRPPLRSLLEVWWPVMAGAAITILVLAILGRQLRRESIDCVFVVVWREYSLLASIRTAVPCPLLIGE